MSKQIDGDALLAFLDRKVRERHPTDTAGLVITSIYSGLANRIRSGEFDDKVERCDFDCDVCREDDESIDPGFEHHEKWCHLQHGLGGRCTCK